MSKRTLMVVLCDNTKSYSINIVEPDRHARVLDKAVVLVRCDRQSMKDNARGLQLANKIAEFLNSLPEEERASLVYEVKS